MLCRVKHSPLQSEATTYTKEHVKIVRKFIIYVCQSLKSTLLDTERAASGVVVPLCRGMVNRREQIENTERVPLMEWVMNRCP